MLQFTSVDKRVSVYGAVAFAMTDFDSPAIHLNDTPYLKEIITLLYFVRKEKKLDSGKFFFIQSVNHTKLPSEIRLKETLYLLFFNS